MISRYCYDLFLPMFYAVIVASCNIKCLLSSLAHSQHDEEYGIPHCSQPLNDDLSSNVKTAANIFVFMFVQCSYPRIIGSQTHFVGIGNGFCLGAKLMRTESIASEHLIDFFNIHKPHNDSRHSLISESD